MIPPFLWMPGTQDNEIPLTDDLILHAEEALGVKLPQSYVEIMREQNGGMLHFNLFVVPEGYHEKWILIDHFEGILPDTMDGILASPVLIKEWEMPANLVLLAGDGHTWLALDYRNTEPADEPVVVYVDNSNDEIIPLAKNFSEFLDGLMDGNDCDVIGIISKGKPAEVLAAQLNHILAINLEKTRFPGLATITYEYEHPQWDSYMDSYKVRLRLERNSPSGYPMFSQYDWLFSFDVKERQLADEIFKKMAEQFDYEVIKIHTPIYR